MVAAASRGYGWKPSLPDHRNYILRFPHEQANAVADIDLSTTGFLPSEVWDQGQLGACVPHGTGELYVYVLKKQGAPEVDPSRLFIYYNGRVIEGTVKEDSGLSCADGLKAVVKYGAPPESDWPYDITKFTQKPPAQAFTDGLQRQVLTYAQVQQTVAQMTACLNNGYPFIVGFTVYQPFESDAVAANGVVPMPKTSDADLGGHCVLVVGRVSGATLIKQLTAKGKRTTGISSTAYYWKCLNSWAKQWGDDGFFYMPDAYLLSPSLAGDFWTIYTEEAGPPTPTPPSPAPTPGPVSPTSGVDRASAIAAAQKAVADAIGALASV